MVIVIDSYKWRCLCITSINIGLVYLWWWNSCIVRSPSNHYWVAIVIASDRHSNISVIWISCLLLLICVIVVLARANNQWFSFYNYRVPWSSLLPDTAYSEYDNQCKYWEHYEEAVPPVEYKCGPIGAVIHATVTPWAAVCSTCYVQVAFLP